MFVKQDKSSPDSVLLTYKKKAPDDRSFVMRIRINMAEE